MDQEEFLQKLDQIEEQAKLTLAEFPKTLTKERQRMIIALVRYIRSEADRGMLPQRTESENEALARLRSA
jgi:CHASE3 domain sensor protein